MLPAADSSADRRRVLIAMATRRSRPGSGSSPELLRARTALMRFPDLTSTLAGVLWAAVGAAATRLYMPERTTNDLDIVIRPQDSAEVHSRLAQAGAVPLGDLSIGGTTWRLSDGFALDVIEGSDGWVESALKAAQVNLDAQQMPVLPMRFLVLMKLGAGRVQDLADVTRMLGQASADDLAAVRAVFEEWMPADRDDLESLIALGQLEMRSCERS
jgi:hypothetical protein